jgi:hypothetical protein
MLLKQMFGLLLSLSALSAVTGFVESPNADRRCSLSPPPPREGYDPVPLVASAQVIVLARADSVSGATPQPRTRPGYYTWVHFTVLEVIDSGAMQIPASIRVSGQLSDSADFNTLPVPFRWVRRDGQRGSCFAYSYQKGGEFLLLLQGTTVDSLNPYWSALTPTNEQVRGNNDPWVRWVREARRASRD